MWADFSQRGEWPRSMGLCQQKCLGLIRKGALEGMDRSGAGLKLRLCVGEQWEKVEKRGCTFLRVLKELEGM